MQTQRALWGPPNPRSDKDRLEAALERLRASATRRSLFVRATALLAVAATPTTTHGEELPDFSEELGRRYLCWLNLEAITMSHHLGLDPCLIPVDRFAALWRTTEQAESQVEARALTFMAAAGLSLEPDMDSAERRLQRHFAGAE